MLRDGAWVPTFPNATYHFPRIDDEVWYPSRARYATMKGAAVNMNVYEDSVRPIIEAGQAVFVDDGDTIAPGMIARAAPGHTPGQMFLEVSSEGQHAMFTGDILHHPMQIFGPTRTASTAKIASRQLPPAAPFSIAPAIAARGSYPPTSAAFTALTWNGSGADFVPASLPTEQPQGEQEW